MKALALALLVCAPAIAADPLPALRAQSAGVTTSGVSSGAYMAVQLHVAHSASVSGVGVVAGGPYYCAQGSVWTAQYHCMTPGTWTPIPSAAYLKTITASLASSGRIDPVKNLAGAAVWLFTGTQDRTVKPEVVFELRRFYELHGARAALVSDRPAGHAMVTEVSGNRCDETSKPFINDCDYDAAGQLLRHLLGTLAPPSARPAGQVMKFDQASYGGYDASMDDEGYAYIPDACAAGGCRVHVAFHGCRQNAAAVSEAFVRGAGYNRWADSNRLIVLYPQTISRYWPIFNPKGCWDWWGYTGPGYHTRDGAQIRAVKAMIDRLASQ